MGALTGRRGDIKRMEEEDDGEVNTAGACKKGRGKFLENSRLRTYEAAR